MFRWEDLKPGVISLLRDIEVDPTDVKSDRSPRYQLDDLRAWWNNAQVRLSTTRPNPRHYLYRNDGIVVSLPPNFYRPTGVILPGASESLPRIKASESFFGVKQPSYYVYENQLYLTGVDKTTVGKGEFVLLYDAYYSRVENDKSIIDVPIWAHEACAFYVAMTAITQEMMRDARYRKFISKNDAGNPTQSPFVPVAKWLRERFYEILNTHTTDDVDSA
jgi:hypothetical protein